MWEDLDDESDDQFKRSPAKQLVDDIQLEFGKTYNEASVFQLLSATAKNTGLDPVSPGKMFAPRKIPVLLPPRARYTVSPELFSYPKHPVSSCKQVDLAAKAKQVDLAAIALFKQKLNAYLIQFNDDLKSKLEGSKDRAKALEMYKWICKSLKPLIKDPSKENLQKFKVWFDTMLSKQKDFFKATPWIWWDILRPLLVGFLGVILTLITAPVRPFVPGVAVYANSFFVKPISPAFKVIMNESDTLFQGIESAAVLAM